jgi:hypothetical protein
LVCIMTLIVSNGWPAGEGDEWDGVEWRGERREGDGRREMATTGREDLWRVEGKRECRLQRAALTRRTDRADAEAGKRPGDDVGEHHGDDGRLVQTGGDDVRYPISEPKLSTTLARIFDERWWP